MNSRTWLDSDQNLLHKIHVFFFKEAAFLMNLDIERTEKNPQRVRSGQVIIGVLFFFRGLLDWVGLGYGGFLPVR